MTRLDEIKARLAAASPGPWRALVGLRQFDLRVGNGFSVPLVLSNNEHTLGEFSARITDADRAMIVNAREDVEYLLAEVERLSAENARLLPVPAPHPDPASLDRENTRLTNLAWDAQKRVEVLEAENKALRASSSEIRAIYEEKLERYRNLADNVADELEKLGFRVFAPGSDVCDND